MKTGAVSPEILQTEDFQGGSGLFNPGIIMMPGLKADIVNTPSKEWS